MAIQTRRVEYEDGGTLLEGFMAWDDSAAEPRPAVAIAHAWGGRSEIEEGRAVRLAECGYVGFVLDMYGKDVRGANPEENAALMTPFMEDRPMLQARMAAGIETVRGQSEVDAGRVAAMGFCFGGLCVLDLARTGSDVRGVASFHGMFGAPGNTAGNTVTARVLCLHGYDDPMAQPQDMLALASELTEAGADWQIHAYGGTVHAFTNPAANDRASGIEYNANADRRSWIALLDFLEEVMA